MNLQIEPSIIFCLHWPVSTCQLGGGALRRRMPELLNVDISLRINMVSFDVWLVRFSKKTKLAVRVTSVGDDSHVGLDDLHVDAVLLLPDDDRPP